MTEDMHEIRPILNYGAPNAYVIEYLLARVDTLTERVRALEAAADQEADYQREMREREG